MGGKSGGLSLILAATAVAISYVWLDRLLATLAHDNFVQLKIFLWLTLIPEPLGPLALIILLVIGIRGLAGRPLARWHMTALLCSLSLITAQAVKNQLKFIFGRTWPETWVDNNPSFIRDGVYGFNPFHAGPGFESFPSGHTSAICAVMSVLWICYPEFRALYALIIAVVTIGLIGADYHFLSDIIAGGFIGVSTGWMAVALCQSCRPSGSLSS